MKLLFVEDDSRSVAQVRKKVEREHSDVECVVMGFAEAKEWISQQLPDIVSLDLLSPGLSGEPEVAGQEIFDSIWKERFCPIIVYSARPDADAEKRPAHPFVKSIKKGRGSPEEFAAAINDFRPHVEAIRDAEATVRKEFALHYGKSLPMPLMSSSLMPSNGATQFSGAADAALPRSWMTFQGMRVESAWQVGSNTFARR